MQQIEDRDHLNTYPLVLTNLVQVRCVVVGGGAVAERKVRELLEGGARPQVISPWLTTQLAEWRDAGRIEHQAREYRRGDLQGAFLAIAATGDRAANAAVAGEGAHFGLLVNAIEGPSGVAIPEVMKRSEMQATGEIHEFFGRSKTLCSSPSMEATHVG